MTVKKRILTVVLLSFVGFYACTDDSTTSPTTNPNDVRPNTPNIEDTERGMPNTTPLPSPTVSPSPGAAPQY